MCMHVQVSTSAYIRACMCARTHASRRACVCVCVCKKVYVYVHPPTHHQAPDRPKELRAKGTLAIPMGSRKLTAKNTLEGQHESGQTSLTGIRLGTLLFVLY